MMALKYAKPHNLKIFKKYYKKTYHFPSCKKYNIQGTLHGV